MVICQDFVLEWLFEYGCLHHMHGVLHGWFVIWKYEYMLYCFSAVVCRCNVNCKVLNFILIHYTFLLILLILTFGTETVCWLEWSYFFIEIANNHESIWKGDLCSIPPILPLMAVVQDIVETEAEDFYEDVIDISAALYATFSSFVTCRDFARLSVGFKSLVSVYIVIIWCVICMKSDFISVEFEIYGNNYWSEMAVRNSASTVGV